MIEVTFLNPVSNDCPIESYIDELSIELEGYRVVGFVDIVEEIRAHLTYRKSQNELDEALQALGGPSEFARRFLPS